jgi:uncharacterized protein YjeT (DUF2065 family)
MDEELRIMLGLGLVTLLLGALGLFAPPQWNPLQLKKKYATHVSPGFAKAIPRVIGAGLLTVGVVLTVVAVLMALGVFT